MSAFDDKDFSVFYSDFVTPVVVAGVAYQLIYTKDELELESAYGIFPVLRSHVRFFEGDSVVVNPDSDSPENYTVVAIKTLEHNEWLHVLQDA